MGGRVGMGGGRVDNRGPLSEGKEEVLMGLGGEHEMTVRSVEEGKKGMEFMGIERGVGLWGLTDGTVIVVRVISGEEGQSTGDSGGTGVMEEEAGIGTGSNGLENEILSGRGGGGGG